MDELCVVDEVLPDDANVRVRENPTHKSKEFNLLLGGPIVDKGRALLFDKGDAHSEVDAIGEADAGDELARRFYIAYKIEHLPCIRSSDPTAQFEAGLLEC